MKYFIVVDEWNYPTSSGREVIGDYDTLEEAKSVANFEYDNEYSNFIEVNGETYEEACGEVVGENGESTGFIINSSKNETENMWFYSRIIHVTGF